MFADTEQRSRTFEQRGDRLRWRAGGALSAAGLAAVVAAGLVAALLASASAASAATLVSHSAKSGELSGGRLVLRGVSGRATYVTGTGRAGTVPVRRLHRRLFQPGKPATGALNPAGYRGGEAPTFRLSQPRYNASRRTVSYGAKPLGREPLPRRAARAPRRFGAASLSIVPHPTLATGGSGGNDCQAMIEFPGIWHSETSLSLQSSSNWDTDTWIESPPQYLEQGDEAEVSSEGGLGRGCHFETVWVTQGQGVDGPYSTFTIDVTWPWTQLPSSTCTPSNTDAWVCRRADSGGEITWVIQPK
jgi:hypothetical protein